MPEPVTLRAAIGRYKHSAPVLDGAVTSPLLRIEDAGIKPVNRAFAPMVREGRFDLSEMAIATFLMAKEAARPLVLLPVVMAARFQEGALLCRADSDLRGPADLRGRRVGARAYSQTTGMWLRGTLAEHGVPADAVRWITYEDAHEPGYRDPPFAERAPAGADMLAMLRDGSLDAAVFGNDLPEGERLRTVFPDPAAAGEAFRARHGFVPVNHLLVLRHDVADAHPEIAPEIVRLFGGITPPGGRAGLAPALTLASEFCAAQGLTARALTLAEIWDGTPDSVA
ncbi:ABC transporter substrate-binding protein [Roseomonas sp. OT10]|uniref:ABC transporter substrate-binding protein n=1 Tax=Roseomonas cutis TaxID=2897332 RepID=UPI001E2E88D6|nr:ABC transporter substrate-binding protein [Roseomonas sp. OT10]UFN46871.1 ABC transporter substrate-binding protein [Roseomonas sp. OT10]